MDGIRIREVRVTDYQDIYMLNVDFNPHLHTFNEDQVKAKLEVITTKTKDIVLVGEHNEEVIGYIHGSPYELLFSDSMLNILGFVVKEGCRNRGVGSRLMEQLEQWGKDQGFAGIKVLSHPSRLRSHRFYERRGFVFTKDQKNYIKSFG